MSSQKLIHSPRLNTILMVERALQDSDSLISVAELKRLLPKQVNHNVLITILDYLEKSNKIAVSIRGITWTANTNSKLLSELNSASWH